MIAGTFIPQYACDAGAPTQATSLAGLQAPHMLNNTDAVSLQFPVAAALLFLVLLLYSPRVNEVRHYLSFASLSHSFNVRLYYDNSEFPLFSDVHA